MATLSNPEQTEQANCRLHFPESHGQWNYKHLIVLGCKTNMLGDKYVILVTGDILERKSVVSLLNGRSLRQAEGF